MTRLGFPATLPRASGGSYASSSDQDAGKPMVQPQRAAAPPAEPALQITGMPPVMTSNRARHDSSELIQLPTMSVKVRLLGTRLQSGTVTPGDGPRLPGDGDAPPSESAFHFQSSGVPVPDSDLSRIGDAPPFPSPICRGRGRSPVPDSHRGPDGGGPRPGIRLRVPPSPSESLISESLPVMNSTQRA